MGIYGNSTFQQGHGATPSAHPIPPSSQCTQYSTVKNGIATLAPVGPTDSVTKSSGSAASTIPQATSTSTSNAASALTSGFQMSGVVGAGVALVAAMVGGVYVL
ncbi:hypothetical protein FRC06_005476 [Ceratobasidium sp. 370]|nr:hypothetical protein FRC06_005476 [Ceratobasidium sp. 370]